MRRRCSAEISTTSARQAAIFTEKQTVRRLPPPFSSPSLSLATVATQSASVLALFFALRARYPRTRSSTVCTVLPEFPYCSRLPWLLNLWCFYAVKRRERLWRLGKRRKQKREPPYSPPNLRCHTRACPRDSCKIRYTERSFCCSGLARHQKGDEKLLDDISSSEIQSLRLESVNSAVAGLIEWSIAPAELWCPASLRMSALSC